MSAVFLIVQGKDPLSPTQDESVGRAAGFLPFVPEDHYVESWAGGRTRCWVWSVVAESARGAYFHHAEGEALAYHGCVREQNEVALDRSIADGLLTDVRARGFEAATRWLEGDYALAHIDPDGRVQLTTDFLGGTHIYYGSRGDLTVVSNRALLVAAALNNGVLPSPDPLAFGMFHYTFSASLGEKTVWPGVHLLLPEDRLQIIDGRARTLPKDRKVRLSYTDWDEAIADFQARVAQIKRLPQMDFQLTLTGGKDSRVVLAGLVATNALDQVKTAYLYADPEHPDVTIGARLAAHYGIPFEVHPAGHTPDIDWRESLARHNFHTECGLNAWDRKGWESKTRRGDLRGYYGEIYKSHEVPGLGLGWPVVRRVYLSSHFLDPQGILTSIARDHNRETLRGWLERHRTRGLPARHAHNLIHLDCRMHRWVGHAQAWDATGAVSMNPIPSERLLHFYRASPRTAQKSHLFHFKLVESGDDWLWRQPFANYQWKASVLPGDARSAPPFRGKHLKGDFRLDEWTRHRAAISDYLMSEHQSGAFFDVYQRRGLKQLLDRLSRNPTANRLKTLSGALGVRHALTETLAPSPVVIPQARAEPRP